MWGDNLGLINLFRRQKSGAVSYATMLNGQTPIFSQFGQEVYASDVVQNCIDVIATECSKLQPKHIWVNGDVQKEPADGSINRIFNVAPNPLMTTSDFIERIIWQLELNFNAFIYPKYRYYTNIKGEEIRTYEALYPLSPAQVTFLQWEDGRLGIEFMFGNGQKVILPYDEIIHLRKKFSINDIMGGGDEGQPDNEAIIETLDLHKKLLKSLEIGIKTGMTIRGILNLNTMLDYDKVEAERQKFEEHLKNNDNALLAVDLKGEYVPIKADPKLIDKDTIEFMQGKILNYYGVPFPIISGDFTDEQYQAFYEKKLEPLLIRLGQAFSKAMLTKRELDMGHQIIFFPQKLLFTNTKNKIAVADILGNRGALTNNQLLELFGYPPYDGGDKRYVSLNYIESQFATQYQMMKKGSKEYEQISTE